MSFEGSTIQSDETMCIRMTPDIRHITFRTCFPTWTRINISRYLRLIFECDTQILLSRILEYKPNKNSYSEKPTALVSNMYVYNFFKLQKLCKDIRKIWRKNCLISRLNNAPVQPKKENLFWIQVSKNKNKFKCT